MMQFMSSRKKERQKMLQLDLSPEEVTRLRETLESVLSELRYEINDTDGHDFREKLKAQKAFLERVIAQLKNG